ncbi:MAG: hypothetical protein Q4A70_00030 [Candidatus Saccharibacteria bacterium]|nr:hypothetical protein [Candidatus Saccharibacteria bacterium]
MAKEVAIGKRAKISEAQQYMLLSVLGAAIVLGVAISLTSHFVKQIIFNAKVIAAEEQSIASYSNVIQKTGVCEKPKGSVYSDEELNKCNPDTIEVSQIPNTLRSNVLVDLAANSALNSVPKEQSSNCINPNTGKNFTYKELNQIYQDAKTSSELISASQLIKSCSALRVIPDALPAFKNEEALLASLNKLFIISGWNPESISPGGVNRTNATPGGLNSLSLSVSVEAGTGTTMTVLRNIERSIRNFDIGRANIEWTRDGTLTLRAQANAYYMTPSAITETETTIKAEGK